MGTEEPHGSDAARHQLARRLNHAVAGLEDPATPMMVVDLDAFDANAADLARRAAGKPIRVASKSLRIPALVERALAKPGLRGCPRLLAARGDSGWCATASPTTS